MAYAGLPEGALVYDGLPAGATIVSAPNDQATSPDFAKRVGGDWSNRAKSVKDMASRNAGSVGETIWRAPKIAALAAGQVAGGINDIAAEGIKSGYNALVPDTAKRYIGNALSSAADTGIGQVVVGAGKKVAGAYNAFADNNPDAAMAVEGTANMAGAIPLVKGAPGAVVGAAKEGANIVGDLLQLNPIRQATTQKIRNAVEEGINKGIRPGVEGKRTFTQTSKYYDNAENAVKTIVDNKANLALTNDVGESITGGLPTNLRQFTEAIDQTKRSIFQKYDEMAKSAGEAGATVDLMPAAAELDKVATNKVLLAHKPEVAAYAAQKSESLAQAGAHTAEDAQEAIKVYNQSLDAFSKNPSYDTASRAYIDSLVVNKLREGLDSAITSLEGPGYQELKNQYGALKSIERDANRRAIVDARKNAKSMIDFTDVLSGEKAISGLLSMNPAQVAQAGGMKMIANGIKALNDPNRHIKNMFKSVNALAGPTVMKSNTFNALGRTFGASQ